MKKQILSCLVPALILALATSAVAILPATSQDTRLIIDKLNELNSRLEGERPALQNKVTAVIHQIEAGALNGAISKLEDDVKKSITAWVDSPEELIQLVDEIVGLIKRISPPPPRPDFEITAPSYRLDVIQGGFNTTIITIRSVNNFSQEVTLSATTSAPETTIMLDPPVVRLSSATVDSILIVDAILTATLGDYLVNVTGASGALKHSVAIPLRIIEAVPTPPEPDFCLNASLTSLVVEQGDAASSTIIVTSLGGFDEAVELTFEPKSISGVILSLEPARVVLSPGSFNTSILKIEVALDTLAQELGIAVTGTSGPLQRTVTISLNLIVEKKPPKILSVSRMPETPAYNDTVLVSANIVDMESGIEDVMLRYSENVVQEIVTMTLSAGLYEATIPAHSFGTRIEYQIQASDKAGNSVTSGSFAYAVADPYQPVIGVPMWSPRDPIANDNIVINVSVIEPEGASGIDKVVLHCSNSTAVFSVNMTDNHDGNWTASISNQTGPKIAFVVEAFDKAGNRVESEIQEFNVSTPAFPLVWILAVIAILAAATGGGAYYARPKPKKGTAAASVPSATTKLVSPHRP